MAYTVKQVWEITHPLIGQKGSSYLIGPNNFIHLINHAVSMVYNYEGMHWSWQHRKDLFNMNGKSQGALFSRRPIRKVDKFRGGNWTDVDKVGLDPCYCNMNLPEKVIPACCDCDCIAPCDPILLAQTLPQNQLCANQYQISGGVVAGMGGMDGRIVKVDLGNKQVNDLWMTYFCGPVKMEKRNDIVPVPDSYVHVLAWIIAATVVPMVGVSRQQEDLTYFSLYRKELDYLRKHDTIVPEEISRTDIGYNITGIDNKPNAFNSISSQMQW